MTSYLCHLCMLLLRFLVGMYYNCAYRDSSIFVPVYLNLIHEIIDRCTHDSVRNNVCNILESKTDFSEIFLCYTDFNG